jgi:excisionase family DNA binding protein
MKAELNIDHQELVKEVTREVIKALKPMLSNNSDGDRLLTTEELCEYLKVDKGWIYQQVHSKAIPFNKAGNKLRFRKTEIDKYLSNGRK